MAGHFSGEGRPRVLIYSHDTYGLGHLRRCRTIAHTLVDSFADACVLIVSGSPMAGSFELRPRVDFVRVPGVLKRPDGAYASMSLPMAIEETLELRASIIRQAADLFDPDVLIVDKEPLGLKGELAPTLERLKPRGTRMVLGLRDVLDAPARVRAEWERKGVYPALQDYYDEIWVYGLEAVHDPLAGVPLPPGARERIAYTGYLPRPLSSTAPRRGWPAIARKPFLLATTGGGGDGDELIDWVLAAYEHETAMALPMLVVLGPYMPAGRQKSFRRRARALAQVDVITFEQEMEHLVARARGVVAMGGYNTFCEILTHDTPALLVPRTHPREEQLIRARNAERLGLAQMLPMPGTDHRPEPAVMAEALNALATRPRPSAALAEGMLGGANAIPALMRRLLGQDMQAANADPAAEARVGQAQAR